MSNDCFTFGRDRRSVCAGQCWSSTTQALRFHDAEAENSNRATLRRDCWTANRVHASALGSQDGCAVGRVEAPHSRGRGNAMEQWLPRTGP